ncbi:hypothetical protein PFICI_08585 [Pestalotiopsis fici W106-1]|uniref:Uncharacterized protein n=1 Tax=Pestalotiopsis fici (strain W106-1 / CGMCC3.15140) TaxID=1229662 RepID=W3X062_PESFW|nr:uncharacterized protein PFICI_08585 [Pestalotiopsis fici W106-1]ETS78732.1 hypothetical protein PFICI_08585 [Pestalotiopsis fici W106-1]
MDLSKILAAGPITPLEATLLGRDPSSASSTQQEQTPSTTSEPMGAQKLPDHIFYLIAKNYIHHPTDLFHLAVTNKSMWAWLKIELYKTEVLFTKEQERQELILDPYECETSIDSILDTHLSSVPSAADRLEMFDARPNLQGGRPALHSAVRSNKIPLAQKLIAASVKHWFEYINVKYLKFTALARAVWRRHDEMVELLVQAGCFVDSWHPELKGLRRKVHDGYELVPGVALTSKTFNTEFCLLYSPLCMAIAMGRREQALLLAQHSNDGGWSWDSGCQEPLHLAAFAGMKAVVITLLERGYTDVVESSLYLDADPLYMAAVGVDDNRDVMELFIADKADWEIAEAWNAAIREHAPKNALMLLQYSFDQHQRNGRQLKGLHDDAVNCLESDTSLPVLQWILQNDEALETRMRVGAACQNLLEQGRGVPSATLAYLRRHNIAEPARPRTVVYEALPHNAPGPRPEAERDA